MENVFIKLKTPITDENVLKLGELRITKGNYEGNLNTTKQYLQIKSNSDIEVRAVNGAKLYTNPNFSNAVDKLSLAANKAHRLYTSLGAEFGITKKYSIVEIVLPYIYDFNLKDLEFCENLINFSLTETDPKNIIKGDLSSISKLTKLKNFVLAGAYSSNITGDISTLNNIAFTELTIHQNLNLTGDIGTLNVSRLSRLSIADTKIFGSVENLVENAIKSGRIAGTIALPYSKAIPNVTYQGIPLPSNSNVPSSSSNNSITWDANGNITWT